MRTKKIVAGLLATAMVITGISIAPKQEAEAAAASGIIYELIEDAASIETYMINDKAPIFDGVEEGMGFNEDFENAKSLATEDYLFGGWYVLTTELMPMAEYEEVTTLLDENEENLLLAKWIPASMLSVKAQNHKNVAEGTEASIRVISAVDCLDYERVGFTIEINNSRNPLENAAAGTTKVYDTLLISGNSTTTTVHPSQYFGGFNSEKDQNLDNEYGYFVVWTLTNIPAKGHDDIIYVRPYWVTADGATVNGLGKYVHVEDGYKGYISVPVNLNMLSTHEVAAGVFEISYPEGFTLVEDKVEIGRVFEEMEFADKGSSVKFAANVADINNDKLANDIYVNLRFTYDGTVTHASNDFLIKENSEDFCDKKEEKKPIDIWDVLY